MNTFQLFTILIFIILIILMINVYHNSKKYNICKNGYIGINTKCKYCMLYKGIHYHHLSKKLFPKYWNIASTGKHCPYCMSHPGEFHFHYLS